MGRAYTRNERCSAPLFISYEKTSYQFSCLFFLRVPASETAGTGLEDTCHNTWCALELVVLLSGVSPAGIQGESAVSIWRPSNSVAPVSLALVNLESIFPTIQIWFKLLEFIKRFSKHHIKSNFPLPLHIMMAWGTLTQRPCVGSQTNICFYTMDQS